MVRPPTTFRLSRCGNSLVFLSFWQQCGYFTLYRIITSVEVACFTKMYWHTSFQGIKSCTGAAFQVCVYTIFSGTEYGDRVGCSERRDTVITSHFVMQMNVFGLYIKFIYFCSSQTQSFYISECTYRSFATRVSQLKIWHFWVIGIEIYVSRCTFNRCSVITEFAKLAAGEQLCRCCTHRKL